jgi:hypothetical protein
MVGGTDRRAKRTGPLPVTPLRTSTFARPPSRFAQTADKSRYGGQVVPRGGRLLTTAARLVYTWLC